MATQWGTASANGVRRDDHGRETRRDAVADLIEGEIIPRLLLAHGVGTPTPVMLGGALVVAADVDTLTPLALSGSSGAVLTAVRAVMSRGVPLAITFTDLIAPVARRLGELWDQDRCDFVEVTMALWRLQETVRDIAAETVAPDRGGVVLRRAVIAACPGDKHSLGTAMVDELFRGAGWETVRPDGDEAEDLVDLVRSEPFDLIGLTVSCDGQLARLPALVTALRSASRNPRIVVMLGGRAINADPSCARRMGADATAPDGPTALARAEALLGAIEAAPAGRA